MDDTIKIGDFVMIDERADYNGRMFIGFFGHKTKTHNYFFNNDVNNTWPTKHTKKLLIKTGYTKIYKLGYWTSPIIVKINANQLTKELNKMSCIRTI